MVINGPNLNLLGVREKSIYGQQDFESFFSDLKEKHPGIELSYYQSNVEGELIDAIQAHGFDADAILINPGGYTHTSVAIRDAIAAVDAPVYEIHISHPDAREEFRKNSLVREVCAGGVSGLGVQGYMAVLETLLSDGP